MILTVSEVASLKSALHWWEWFGYSSTAVVGIGCIGEFLAEFTALTRSEQSKHRLSKLSLIVLILGIAGELLSASRTSQLSGRIIANVEERAADADQKAGEANDRASENEKEAAQLRKDAESERLARVKIEEDVAWRRLTKENDAKLESHLRRFSGQYIWPIYNINDAEAFSFATDIAKGLRNVGWDAAEPEPIMKMAEGPVPLGSIQPLERGVVISDSGDEASRNASNALISVLVALGFDANRSPNSAIRKERQRPTVFVSVEPRPEGPQGAAKLRYEAEAKKIKKSPTANE